MSKPTSGQPYNEFTRFSIGDPGSVTPGSPAYRGIDIITTGALPPEIVDPTESFSLTTYLKGECIGGYWLNSAILAAAVEHHLVNIVTGAETTLTGCQVTSLLTPPPGASAPNAPWLDQWFCATSPATSLPAGAYRVITLVRGMGMDSHYLAAFHEFILISQGAPAVTIYYVAPGGSDQAAGDLGHPWKTIQKAAETVGAGDTVFVRDGTYRERVVHSKSGLPGNPIRFAAYRGETVTVDGAGIPVPTDQGLWDFNGQHYITESGFHLVNAGYAGFYADGCSHLIIERNTTYRSASSGIGVWNSHHVIIDGNEVTLSCSNGMQESLTIAVTDNFEVRNNRVYNAPGYEKEGICLKDGSHDGFAYKNIVHDTWAVGFYIDAWDKHTRNIEVYQNLVYNGRGDGFALASEMGGLLENIKVYNNLSYRNCHLGLTISPFGGSSTHPIRNVQIINNTLVDNGTQVDDKGNTWGGGLSVDSLQAENIIIRNNIISQNGSFQLVKGYQVPTNQLTVDHNLIDPLQNYYDNEHQLEFHSSEDFHSSPQFANAAGRNYHLTALSPAIDRGSMLNAPAFDFDGSTRPLGNGYDIGTYEYNPANH